MVFPVRERLRSTRRAAGDQRSNSRASSYVLLGLTASWAGLYSKRWNGTSSGRSCPRWQLGGSQAHGSAVSSSESARESLRAGRTGVVNAVDDPRLESVL